MNKKYNFNYIQARRGRENVVNTLATYLKSLLVSSNLFVLHIFYFRFSYKIALNLTTLLVYYKLPETTSRLAQNKKQISVLNSTQFFTLIQQFSMSHNLQNLRNSKIAGWGLFFPPKLYIRELSRQGIVMLWSWYMCGFSRVWIVTWKIC